jgi:hypothetical protein
VDALRRCRSIHGLARAGCPPIGYERTNVTVCVTNAEEVAMYEVIFEAVLCERWRLPLWRRPVGAGVNKPHREDRQWVLARSPEQIAKRLKVDFPDDESMRISNEAIYQSLLCKAVQR